MLPSLVLLCQRAAIARIDAIDGLGDLAFPLVQPILARCSPAQLLRFERLSPANIWRDLCFQSYHLAANARFVPSDDPHPDSWRSRFFALQAQEAQRIEQVGSKIRSQRHEADVRKKEKEVKLTDRLPPAKRPRTGAWNSVSQPKSLFQKTRTEASKIQRALNARILPPPRPSGSSLPSPVSVNVNSTSVHHRPSIPIPTASTSIHMVSDDTPSSPPDLVTESPRPLPKMRSPAKKDPMASLFLPKRKRPT